ncbi:MAG: hypothetical protein ACM3PP_12335 [Candidatus Saccharibacteria bacterium]
MINGFLLLEYFKKTDLRRSDYFLGKEFADKAVVERIKRALEALETDPECLNPLLIPDEVLTEMSKREP